MSKIQKQNTVQLNLQNVQQFIPSQQIQVGSQIGGNSPKPPLGSKSNKSPKGDCSFRVISPKMTINLNNSQRSISKSSSPIEKQISEPDKLQYLENENDAVIEDNQINTSDVQQIRQIKQKLMNMGELISSFHLVDINLKVLKKWQYELLQETKTLLKLNKNVINLSQTKIISPRPNQIKKISSDELLEKLQNEQKKRLDAEEQSGRILQDQEKYIQVLNEKLFQLEQQYSKKKT
ncbi:unnamed protein product [Paramecium pentaurelia]|uniref:Uncharacterized protein n=1 Tax=Paramecium pentaurelia TaxID=43138 RepID=A0A8S1VVX5_9CILI|nr:unnamed protein product [Paramecium pentaurelia]